MGYKRKIEDYEYQLNSERLKTRDLEEEVIKAQK